MASDVKIEFDLVTGKNDVSKSIDDIKRSASSSSSVVDLMLGKISNVGKEFSKNQKDTKAFFDSAKDGANKTSSSVMGFSTAITATIASIAGAAYSIKEFIAAAIESEDSISRLNVSLKQTGIYTDSSSKYFQDLATQIQNTTVYSDDQAMSLISTLQTLGQFTKEGLVKATKASIELASAMKMDLGTAATYLGKAANGNVIALQKMGIEITKGKTDAETFANTLQALSRLQGSSAAEVNTLGGAFKVLGNQVDEAKETFGGIISETFQLKEVAIGLANSLKKVNEEIKTNATAKAAENIKSARSEYNGLTEDIDETIDAYQRLRDEKTKVANQQRFQTEEFLKQNKLISDSLDAFAGIPFKDIGKQSANVKLPVDIVKNAQSEEDIQNTKARREEAAAAALKSREEYRKNFFAQIDQIKNAGKTQFEIIELEKEKRLSLIKEAFSANKISISEALAARINTESEFQNKKKEIEKKARDDKDKEDEKSDAKRLKKQQELSAKISTIAGLGTNILQGKQGAVSALQTGASLAADSFMPGTGQAASALIGQLSQGPEANREMIKQFAAAVPELVQGIVESIPVIVEELSNQFPKIVEKMSEVLSQPKFWEGFTKSLLKASIASAMSMPKAFIAQLPVFFKEFGKGLLNTFVDGLKNAVQAIIDAINPFKSDGDGLLGLGVLGLARGGQVSRVPQSFPNDTFPAMLSSNELVVDRSTAERLNKFLDGNASTESTITDALLNKILEKLSAPMNVSTTTTLNGRAFADIILELNRSNARLA